MDNCLPHTNLEKLMYIYGSAGWTSFTTLSGSTQNTLHANVAMLM